MPNWWTKYDTQKLIAVVMIASGWLLWPKDSKRPSLINKEKSVEENDFMKRKEARDGMD